MALDLTESQRRWAFRLGYPLLALAVFVMALHFTFPYWRVSDTLVSYMRRHYEVTGAETHAGLLPGSFSLDDIRIETRPESEEEKPTRLVIDSLGVDVGLLAAMTRTLDLQIDLEVGDGQLEADIERSMKTGALALEVLSEALPMEVFEAFLTKVTGGAPIKGFLDMEGSLVVPEGLWGLADGTFDLTCRDCTFGGKGTKLRPMKRNAFSSAGLTLPRALKLGKATGSLKIDKGKGVLTFAAKSDHGELRIDVKFNFTDPVGRSPVEGFAKYRFSDKLLAEDTKLDAMNASAIAARLPDGFTGVRIFGELGAMRFKLSRRNPLEDAEDDDAPSRPTAPAIPSSPARPVTPPPSVEVPPMRGDEEEEDEADEAPRIPDIEPGTIRKGFEPTRPIVRPEALRGGASGARILPPHGSEADDDIVRPRRPDDVGRPPPPETIDDDDVVTEEVDEGEDEPVDDDTVEYR